MYRLPTLFPVPEYNDAQALNAFTTLTRTEGIIPTLEFSHAAAHAIELANQLPSDRVIVVNLSRRGD